MSVLYCQLCPAAAVRLLCCSCARLPRLGPLRYQAAACLAVLRYYPGLFAFPAPHRFATLQSCPLLPPAASSYRCVPCSPDPPPGRTGCSRCSQPLPGYASLPAPQLIATSSPRLHAAAAPQLTASPRTHLAAHLKHFYATMPALQLTASPRTHLAAHPAACSLPPPLRLNVAARPTACAKPLPHVAARPTAALRAAAHPAAHSHFEHLGCTSLPFLQLTAEPRLLVAACPAAHSFTSAQLPAPCSLHCVCLSLRSPLQLAIRVWCSSAARSSQLAI